MQTSSYTALAVCLIVACSAELTLVSFDDASSSHTFVELNDPVMGGKSTGTWSVDTTGKFGIFEGEVVDVPSLSAPGFIKAASDGKFPDLSSTLGGNLVLMVRSSTPEFVGFRLAFASGTLAPSYACSAGGSIPFSRGCFKAGFTVPAGDTFTAVTIPFTSFSDMWSPATGDPTKECADDSDVCPTAKTLKDIKRIELWAEGAKGKVHLEISKIFAQPGSVTQLEESSFIVPTTNRKVPAAYDGCSGIVQDNLKFNIGTRNATYFPDESMAAAVCCDSRMLSLAETQFLFEAPDIQLFSVLEKTSGVTTFYDSVCGVPLFRAPMNRTLKDFEADTNEHGWPSFRPAEVVQEHVMTNKSSGLVTSSCGTHLGSFLPDDQGARWCMDLSCISGRPMK